MILQQVSDANRLTDTYIATIKPTQVNTPTSGSDNFVISVTPTSSPKFIDGDQGYDTAKVDIAAGVSIIGFGAANIEQIILNWKGAPINKLLIFGASLGNPVKLHQVHDAAASPQADGTAPHASVAAWFQDVSVNVGTAVYYGSATPVVANVTVTLTGAGSANSLTIGFDDYSLISGNLTVVGQSISTLNIVYGGATAPIIHSSPNITTVTINNFFPGYEPQLDGFFGLQRVDASISRAGIDFDLADHPVLTTFIGSASSDNIYLRSDSDTIYQYSTALQIDGGAGNDNLIIGPLHNILDPSSANFAAGLVTATNIEHYVLDNRVRQLTVPQQLDIQSSNTLYDAVVKAAAATFVPYGSVRDLPSSATSQFVWHGDTYILVNQGNQQLSQFDGLVRIVGTSATGEFMST